MSNGIWPNTLLLFCKTSELVTTRLSGEVYPTLSLLIPLMSGLQKTLEPKQKDKSVITKVKQALRKELKRRFSLDCLDVESKVVLAAALDPRFRGLTLLSEDERKEVEACLIRITSTEVQQSSSSESGTDPDKQLGPTESDRLDQLLEFLMTTIVKTAWRRKFDCTSMRNLCLHEQTLWNGGS